MVWKNLNWYKASPPPTFGYTSNYIFFHFQDSSRFFAILSHSKVVLIIYAVFLGQNNKYYCSRLKKIFLINLVYWLMGILNLVYCYLFLFVSLAWYRQSISKRFFVKSQCQSPFPLSLESWHLLKVDRE